jgi:CheY-like chemotaxis protein
MVEPSTNGAYATRIMVVEDHKDTRDVLGRLLQSWGYSVKVCETGQEALAEAPAFQPEVILLDLGLPLLDGYQVAEQLEPYGEKPVLIALSGYGQQVDVDHCRQVGFDMHLLKPVDASVLRDALLECQARRDFQGDSHKLPDASRSVREFFPPIGRTE